MPKKAKPTGTVVYASKPDVPETAPSPPPIDIPPQGTPTEAPAPPPPAPSPITPVPTSEPTAKGKRVYRKKNEQYWEAMRKSRKEMLMPPPPKAEPKAEPKNEVIYPKEERKEPPKPV